MRKKILIVLISLFIFVTYRNVKGEIIRKESYGGGYSEIEYKDNKKNGIARFYDKNNKLRQESFFKDNEKEGNERQFDENGNVIIERIWKDGKPQSLKEYDAQGNLVTEGVYEDGKFRITATHERRHPRNKREELILEATDYAAEGNFEEALKSYKSVAEVEKVRLIAKFIKLLEDILDGKTEKDIGLHLFKGFQILNNNVSPNPVEAINEFKWVMNVKPDCELAYFIFGDACYHSNCSHTEEGKNIIPAFKKAIEIDPNFALAHYWLAFSYCFLDESADIMNKCKLAIEHYEKALELDPSLKELYKSKNDMEPSGEQFMDVCRKVLKGEIPIK